MMEFAMEQYKKEKMKKKLYLFTIIFLCLSSLIFISFKNENKNPLVGISYSVKTETKINLHPNDDSFFYEVEKNEESFCSFYSISGEYIFCSFDIVDRGSPIVGWVKSIDMEKLNNE